jgi:hypothetical protein
MKFKIPCKWTVRTVEEVEARTLEEAESKTMDLPGPKTLDGAEITSTLFPVDMERMEEMHPWKKPTDPMKGWKKTADDTFNKCWEKRFGDARVKVWAHGDPEDGVGPWFPEYLWTIEKDSEDFSMTSKECFCVPEEAAESAKEMVKKLKKVIGL